jgi:hypothetical protein
LQGQTILFARRYTYDSPHFYDDYYQGIHQYGGSLARLSLDDGTVTDVVPELNGGIFRPVRPLVRCPPRRLRLPAAVARGNAAMGSWRRRIGIPAVDLRARGRTAADGRYSLHAVGSCQANPSLHAHWTDDMHPCYLPDGRIVFASSRCERTAVCGGHTLPCTVLYRIDADGRNMERLSQGMLSEFTPTVLDDGRILYTRWEYVYKGIAAIQPLWAMRPDGSGSEEIYGNNIRDPGVFYQARQVPGRSNRIVATGCGHEPLAVGSILLVDLHGDKRSESAMTSLTPDTTVRELRGLVPAAERPVARGRLRPVLLRSVPAVRPVLLGLVQSGRAVQRRGGLWHLSAGCLRQPGADLRRPRDVLLHADPAETTAGSPGVASGLRARCGGGDPGGQPGNEPVDATGTLLLTDVYEGLPGVERGEVKYLRVLRQVERPWSVWPHAQGDAFPGQMVAVSWYSHIWIAVLEGVVPVHEDGSAYFTAASDANLFFQALDGDFLEVQRMRTFINLRPGEQRSCIGCHEHRTQAPPRNLRTMPLASAQSAGATRAATGRRSPAPAALRNRRAADPGQALRLVSREHRSRGRSDADRRSNGPFQPLLRADHEQGTDPHPARMDDAAGPGHVGSLVDGTCSAGHTLLAGFAPQPVDRVLREGHHDVVLSQPEWVKLATWIDTNGQYYGSYFGLRNLRYRDRPGFREPPTLESAYGIRPGPGSEGPLEPVPAELVAHWRFDEPTGPWHDDSGEPATTGCWSGRDGSQGPAAGRSGSPGMTTLCASAICPAISPPSASPFG